MGGWKGEGSVFAGSAAVAGKIDVWEFGFGGPVSGMALATGFS